LLHVFDYVAGRRGARIQETIRELPRYGHGDSESASVPQYGTVGSTWAPLGDTWYDALQIKVTKRYSRGLDLTGSYAYSKNETNSDGSGNIFDRVRSRVFRRRICRTF